MICVNSVLPVFMIQALLPTSSGRTAGNSNPSQQRTAKNPYVSVISRRIQFSEPDGSDYELCD
jgi:hypothetical protein